MAKQDNFPAVFAQLKAILEPLTPPLLVESDTVTNYTLHTIGSEKYPQGLFFGAAIVGKSYVSYHLFPLYMYTDLLDGIPELLLKRKQGKTCFNFTKIDDEQVAGLVELTRKGMERFKQMEVL